MNIFSCRWQLLDAPVPYSAPSARLWAQQTCGPTRISNHVYPLSTAKINLSTCWPISLWKHTSVAHTSLAHSSWSVFVPGSGIGPSKVIWKFYRVLSVIMRKRERRLIIEKMHTWEFSSLPGSGVSHTKPFLGHVLLFNDLLEAFCLISEPKEPNLFLYIKTLFSLWFQACPICSLLASCIQDSYEYSPIQKHKLT